MYLVLGVFLAGLLFVLVGIVLSVRVHLKAYDVNCGINVTVGHLSDTHFRSNMDPSTYQNTIDELNQWNPEIIVFTGDMFQEDDITDELYSLALSIFQSLDAPYKYAVLGNHDYYTETKLQRTKDILSEAGFHILINQNEVISINQQPINIVGLDDLMFGNTDYQAILETSSLYDYTIVLSHEPDTFDDVHPFDVNIMFSGHSHGGQVRLPLLGSILNVPGAKEYNERTYTKNDTVLYISFGLGQSLINIRMYDPRQIEYYRCS